MDIELLLTAKSPIAHGHAGAGDTGNIATFNRRGQFIDKGAGAYPTAEEIAAFCAAHPVPGELAEPLREVDFGQFVAIAYVQEFLSLYNTRDGVGLLAGVERYNMLERKLTSAAILSSSLMSLWTTLCNAMMLPIHDVDSDATLLGFWSLPTAIQRAAVAVCVEQARSIITVARVWSQAKKMRNPKYAAVLQQEARAEAFATLAFDPEPAGNAGMLKASVPVITPNSVRHQLVRTPSWEHLTRTLGIPPAYAGQGPLPLAAESIFVNGGNIKPGAKQPQKAFALAGRIRQTFPSLDLLGGVTDSFDIGESALKVSAWLVCRENREGLPASLQDCPAAQVSAFDMLDQFTETRIATINNEGQMILIFEVLAPGSQLYVRLYLAPWTQPLARGALVCAVREYMQGLPIIGGKSARGYGMMSTDTLSTFPSADDDAALYEQYLAERRDELVGWLVDGTLGAGVVVCS